MSNTSAPAPVPARESRRFLPWWLPGAVLGCVAAAIAFAVAQARSPREPAHRAVAVVQLPANLEPEARRRQAFLLRSRDLVARALAEPAVAALPSVRGAADPVADVGRRLAVAEVAPDVLSVTLVGDNPDDLKVILDHLVKQYVDDATGFDRRERDDQQKKLEQLSEAMRVEIDATEKNIELLVRANGTGGQDGAARLAIAQRRLQEVEAEHARTGFELTRTEAELAVLKRRAEKKGLAGAEQDRLAVLTDSAEVAREVRERIRAERDALQKVIAVGAAGGLDLQNMRAALKPQRDALGRVNARLIQLRIDARTAGRTELRGEAVVETVGARVDRLTAAGAPAGVAFAGGFVLATAFSLVGLLFRVLRRLA